MMCRLFIMYSEMSRHSALSGCNERHENDIIRRKWKWAWPQCSLTRWHVSGRRWWKAVGKRALLCHLCSQTDRNAVWGQTKCFCVLPASSHVLGWGSFQRQTSWAQLNSDETEELQLHHILNSQWLTHPEWNLSSAFDPSSTEGAVGSSGTAPRNQWLLQNPSFKPKYLVPSGDAVGGIEPTTYQSHSRH